MNTDTFIQNFTPIQNQEYFPETAAKWIYSHPTVVRVIEVVGMIIGALAIGSLPVSLPFIGLGALGIAAFGALIAAVSFAALKALDIIIPPEHDMKTQSFAEGSYKAAKLTYQGNVPILELDYTNPFEAGFSHGYLLGKQIDTIFQRLEFIKWLTGPLGLLPEANNYPETLRTIRESLPVEYQEELQGLVDGVNQWKSEQKIPSSKKLSIDDLLMIHLMPDNGHFHPSQYEEPVVGCTSLVARDRVNGLEFARTMDWPSFGLFGTYSLIVNRKHKNGKMTTVEVGMPGLIGTLTGMNEKSLSLAMNVCNGTTSSLKNMPSVFFNRHCLETLDSVTAVDDTLKVKSPLGSYHLTSVDKESAQSFHFFQEPEDTTPVVRKYTENEPLITTNCRYLRSGEKKDSRHHSFEREETISRLFHEATKEVGKENLEVSKLLQYSLTLPLVNSVITVHKVMMNPTQRKIQVAFNNAYAGQSPLCPVDTAPLFAA